MLEHTSYRHATFDLETTWGLGTLESEFGLERVRSWFSGPGERAAARSHHLFSG